MKPSLLILLMSAISAFSLVAADRVTAQPVPATSPVPPPLVTGAPAAPLTIPQAPAVATALYDPQQFPAVRGTVARYTLTPRGDVDGLILADGTEVRFPPHLSIQLVYAVRPGDAVTVRGLKALGMPMIAAVSITNDASGQGVIDNGPPRDRDRPGPAEPGQPMRVQGQVQTTLHGPRGDVNGAMLLDGTILRLPPPEAERFSALLLPGQFVIAQGEGLVTSIGRVVEVQAIGAAPNQMSEVQAPPPPGPSRKPRP
jgi:hypothetical protein